MFFYDCMIVRVVYVMSVISDEIIYNTHRSAHGSDPTGLPSLPKDMAVTPRDYHG